MMLLMMMMMQCKTRRLEEGVTWCYKDGRGCQKGVDGSDRTALLTATTIVWSEGVNLRG